MREPPVSNAVSQSGQGRGRTPSPIPPPETPGCQRTHARAVAQFNPSFFVPIYIRTGLLPVFLIYRALFSNTKTKGQDDTNYARYTETPRPARCRAIACRDSRVCAHRCSENRIAHVSTTAQSSTDRSSFVHTGTHTHTRMSHTRHATATFNVTPWRRPGGGIRMRYRRTGLSSAEQHTAPPPARSAWPPP